MARNTRAQIAVSSNKPTERELASTNWNQTFHSVSLLYSFFFFLLATKEGPRRGAWSQCLSKVHARETGSPTMGNRRPFKRLGTPSILDPSFSCTALWTGIVRHGPNRGISLSAFKRAGLLIRSVCSLCRGTVRQTDSQRAWRRRRRGSWVFDGCHGTIPIRVTRSNHDEMLVIERISRRSDPPDSLSEKRAPSCTTGHHGAALGSGSRAVTSAENSPWKSVFLGQRIGLRRGSLGNYVVRPFSHRSESIVGESMIRRFRISGSLARRVTRGRVSQRNAANARYEEDYCR